MTTEEIKQKSIEACKLFPNIIETHFQEHKDGTCHFHVLFDQSDERTAMMATIAFNLEMFRIQDVPQEKLKVGSYVTMDNFLETIEKYKDK